MTGARVFAITGLGLAIVGAVGTVVVRIAAPAPFISGLGFGPAAMAGYVIAGLTWASIGALLVVRRSENTVGWLMVVVGVGYSLSQLSVSLTFAFAAQGNVQGERLAQLAGWVTVLLQLVTILQFAIAFLFPTGRPQSSGWARFMRLFWAFTIVFVVTSLTQPGPLQLIPGLQNPFGFGPDLRGDRPIAPLLAVITLVVFACLGLSMVTRYRSAGRIERQQLKWFVLASGLSAIALGIVTWEVLNRRDNPIGLTVYVFAGALAPIAIGIAMLRYHLYDIDRIISRTIAYALISAVLVATYAAAILVLTGPLGTLLGGDTVSVALSTLVVAALFQPLRRRVQTMVDRRFDRARFDADRTTAEFSGRLRDEVDIGTVTADLRETVQTSIKPDQLGVWLREAGR